MPKTKQQDGIHIVHTGLADPLLKKEKFYLFILETRHLQACMWTGGGAE